MLKKCIYAGLIIVTLYTQGCSTLFQKDKDLKKYQMQEEQYTPYKVKNTVDGYKEFISLYPKNMFVSDAKLQIENLEFAPFDQEDSVEGYMEFKLRYPLNRHGYKASVKIEQSELKRYERIDSKEGYQEFLAKYPESNFAVLAKERLQELEFRQLDVLLREKYGFDLPLYRLYLKRLKKTLGTERGLDLGAYTFFASIVTLEEKKYFHTHFIYATDISYLYTTAAETSDTFFDRLVSPAVAYLGNNFKAQDKIDGLSFDIAWSAHSYHGDRHIMRAYYFPVRAALLFASDKLDKDGLLAQSVISGAEKVSPEHLAPHLPQPQSAAINSGYETGADEVLDGMRIMTIVAERNRGDDSIIASSWQRGRHTMKTITKRKSMGGADDILDKSLIRYIDPPAFYGNTILIWNYRNREKAFWHKALHSSPGRITDTESLRPPAEADFSPTDYLDANPHDENHLLLRKEDYEGNSCYVVESTPRQGEMKYGRRLSWIDATRFIPLKIEYSDKEGKPSRIMRAAWQQFFGLWFWKEAVVENMKTAENTTIIIDDVRINQGLNDLDFTVQGLERQKHGF